MSLYRTQTQYAEVRVCFTHHSSWETTFGGILNSGSMACIMSETAEDKFLDAGELKKENESNFDIVLTGCGGSQVKPKSAYDCDYPGCSRPTG